MTDAFKILTGARVYPTPPADRIVPRYPAEGRADQLPDDAFDLPPAPKAPSDKELADRIRKAATALAAEVAQAKLLGLSVDIVWDYEEDKPTAYIVREF